MPVPAHISSLALQTYYGGYDCIKLYAVSCTDHFDKTVCHAMPQQIMQTRHNETFKVILAPGERIISAKVSIDDKEAPEKGGFVNKFQSGKYRDTIVHVAFMLYNAI